MGTSVRVCENMTMCLSLCRLVLAMNCCQHIANVRCLLTAAPSLDVYRRQQTLQTATQSFKSLAATQQHMEELSNRLAVCSSAVAAAHTEVEASRGAGKG